MSDEKDFCIADCGCAGAREAKECQFIPACGPCTEARDAEAEERFLQPIGRGGYDQDRMAQIMKELKR